jgi:UDP-N-acetyl-D-glucosamine dehydrogenase
VDKIQNALNEVRKPLKGSHVHVLGVAYKRDIDDVRESPALDIMHLLSRRGVTVTYSDPYIPSIQVEQHTYSSDKDPDTVAKADCVVIITDHKATDYATLVERAQLIVDTRNALKGIQSPKIFRL